MANEWILFREAEREFGAESLRARALKGEIEARDVSTRIPIAPSDWQPKSIRYREAVKDGVPYRFADGLAPYDPAIDGEVCTYPFGIVDLDNVELRYADLFTTPRSNRGGAPRKYDWEAGLIALCTEMFYGGVKENDRAGQHKFLTDWFAERHDNGPSESEIRKRVKAVHEALAAREAQENG